MGKSFNAKQLEMKKINDKLQFIALVIVATLCMATFACSDKDSPITPEVKLANTEFTFPNSGGAETLAIQTNVPLEVVSADESWCTVTKIVGESTKVVQYTITTTANTVAEARETTITVSGSEYSSNVTVKQTSGDLISITSDAKSYECNKEGGEFTVTLQTSGAFSIKIGSSWISEIEKTDTSAKFSIPANIGTARTTTITFICGTATTDFVVKQAAGENVMSGADAMAVAQSLGLGWNLGNQFDANNSGISSETAWGNPATTQDAFYKIAESGIRSVRIPITWLGHIGTAPNYTIDATWLNRIAEVIGYAENAGLKAIINIHHDGADSKYWLNIKDAATTTSVNTQVKAQLKAMWTQIAEKLKDKGNFLIFESMNEIHDGKWGWGANLTDGGKQYAVLNEWNQVFVDAVRATGGNNNNRYLGVQGYVTNPDLTIKHFVLPTDIVANRLMVSVHYYAPTDYTLNDIYSEWGHTAASGKKDSYGDEAEMKTIFGKLKTKFVDNGIPVYIGEIGCVHRSTARPELFRKYYLEYVCKAAKTYGLAPIYWDNGSTGTGKECSGLLNHGTGNYINNGEDIIALMVKAITNEDASYTLDSVYDGAPQ